MEKKSIKKLIDEEFERIMNQHPEFVQKLLEFTNLTEEAAKEKTKRWFYLPNHRLNDEKPIDIYREKGPDSLYRFFEKPDWSSMA